MIESICSWIIGGLGSALSWLVSLFLGLIKLDLNLFYNIFPIVGDAYKIIQVASIGIILFFAARAIIHFYTGDAADTPVSILIRTLFAGAAVFMGGYVVELVVNVAKYPYDAMFSLLNRSVENAYLSGGNLFGNITGASIKSHLAVAGLGGAAISLILLVLIWMITKEIIKLLIEVMERFLVVGVIAYTAPLAFSTLASKETNHVFRKWCGMFGGECVIMSLSVWTLAIILSAFGSANTLLAETAADITPVWLRLFAAFAMCKVARRIDSYMTSLGFGVQTGDADGIVGAFASSFGGAFAGSKASQALDAAAGKPADSTVLGAAKPAPSSRPIGNIGGMIGGVRTAWAKGRDAYKEGGSFKQVASASAKGFGQGFLNVPIISKVRADRRDRRLQEQLTKAETSCSAMHEKFKDTGNRLYGLNQDGGSGGSAQGEKQRTPLEERAYHSGESAQQFAAATLERYGSETAARDSYGDYHLVRDNAARLGQKVEKGDTSLEIDQKSGAVKGSDNALADYIGNNMDAARQPLKTEEDIKNADARTESAKATVEAPTTSSFVAEEVLTNTDNNLVAASTTDQNGKTVSTDTVASPLIHKAFGKELVNTYNAKDRTEKKPKNMAGITADTQFKNVSAMTDERTGGRVITAEYQKGEGKNTENRKLEILDSVQYLRQDKREQKSYTAFQSEATGETYYTRTKKMDDPSESKGQMFFRNANSIFQRTTSRQETFPVSNENQPKSTGPALGGKFQGSSKPFEPTRPPRRFGSRRENK